MLKDALKRWELTPEPSAFAKPGTSNRDLDPTPPEMRTWTQTNFWAYWLADALNISTWEMASSMLSVGLSMRYAIPCIFLGHFIIAMPITLQGTTGAILRVPFPIQARSSFGHHLSWFAVVSRVILALFWFAVQCYTGSQCVQQMLVSWAPGFRNFPNHLSESAGITSSGMLCYFIFWIVQFPFLFIHPSKIRWFFLAKSIMVPIAFIGMFIWALVQAGTGTVFQRPATVHGSALGWAFMSSMNSVLGNYATLSVNIPDFTRYATSPRAQYVQMFIIPVVFTFTAFIGIVVSSAGEVIYGTLDWNPLILIDNFADDGKGRAARFFCSFAFAFATIGTNISANSISAANDLTAMFPRYINIRRGCLIVGFIGGWCMAPWEILANATSFLSFMSGYTSFLGPICGLLVADYWLLRRGKIDVPSLYLAKQGRYWYTAGINWRALVTLLCTVTPTLPGLANAINPSLTISQGAKNLYSITWLFSFVSTCVLYTAISKIFPDGESYVPEAIYGHDENGEVDHDHAAGRGSPREEEGDHKEGDMEKMASVGVHQV